MKTESKQKIRKVRRKAFSLLLAVVLVTTGIDLSLFTATVMADDVADDVNSGTLGKNVTWSYDESANTLTISGTGNMNDYAEGRLPFPTSIMEKEGLVVKIEEGVTGIGEYVFAYTRIKEIEIPESVTSISARAFQYCLSLTAVAIPDSVETIGWYAFFHCAYLTEIKLPSDLKGIESSMLSGCTPLTSVTIPDSVRYISSFAFRDCRYLTSVTIPENVEVISSTAFEGCSALGEVVMEGENPPELGDYVFRYCKFVTNNTEGITVPETAVGAYLTNTTWKEWWPYIKNKKAGIGQVIETVLNGYDATKKTMEEDIKSAVEQKLTEVGISGAAVTIEDFQKTDTNISGTVNATFTDEEGEEEITVPINITIRTQLTDEEKVAAAKEAVEGVLRDYTATNDTTKEEIESEIAKALETVEGIDGTSAELIIIKTDALLNRVGQVWGKVTITSGSQTDTVKFDKEIARLMPLDGMGTAEDPYQVDGKEALEKLRDLVNGGEDFAGAHFLITADINLEGSGENLWTPIGTEENPFKGTLDGDGHTVSGLHINDGTKDDQGLFGVNAGTIENLTVEGSVTGKDNVGGIAGTNTADGTIKDCTSNVTVTGENNVGGTAGKNDGTIADCTNNGTVTGTGNNVGGVTGNNTGTVNGSDNTGTVSGNDNVGGITGNNTGTVSGGDNTGTVSGNDNVGGIAGNNTGTVSGDNNTGAVNGNDNVGGITGNNTGTVSGDNNTGAVNGNDNVGGIAGNNTGTVEDSTNRGAVTGTGTGAGGIAGTNNGSLDNDTNTAPVTGKDDVGGITGANGETGTVGGCTNSGNVTVSGDGDSTPGAVIGNNQNTAPDAVKDDYYQKTDTVNNDLTGIGEGTGAGRDPAGITSGQTPMNPEKPFDGSGTAEDPYKIAGKDDLENLCDLVNGGKDFTDVYFEVTKDIDLGGSGENLWTPIGTEENPFKGTLDGDGHIVSGLHINDETKDDQGLFGVNAGTIENLTVEGSVTGKDNVGGIAGTNTESGVIKDCTSNVTVTGENNVGGIAGKNDGTIADCTNNGTVAGTGNNVGGITGTNTGTVNGSDNTGAVNGNDNVGGIAGNNTGTVSGDNNTGAVNGNDNVGGITGNNTGTVSGDNNTGAVNGNDNVGGITGTNTGTVEDSTNRGTVTGTGTGAGGIAGTNNGSLDNDTNTAPVTGKDDVGGITGTNGENGTVEGCTNSGNVTVSGDGNSTPGAIIGNNQNTNPDAVKDDYYQKTDTVNKDLTGIGEGTGAGRNPAGITSGQTPTKPLDGYGTAEDPYKITSKEDLENLRGLVNGGKDFTDVHFELTKDIDLGGSGKKPWTPIGTEENPFKGTLDGDGHTVSGLHTNDGTKDNQGLFGVNAGTIENLTVEGSVTGKDNVGGIAGTNTKSGVIKDCTSSVTVTGENNVGGIAGKNDGTITDCTNNGTVTGTGNNAGGITGTNTGTVNGSDNTGAVNGNDNVGGIAGNNTGTVNGSDNTGAVNGNDNVGGVTGNNTGTVNGSDNTGTVNGNDNVGGIAGTNTGTVSGGDNTGAVSGNDNVGGITGNNTGTVEDSTNRGTVTGTGTGAGGIAGTNNGSLKDDTNTAPVTGKDDVGGITGTNGEDGTVEGCTNSGNVTVSGDGDSTPGAVIGNNQNTDPDAVKDDYYQKTDTVNNELTGIGEGTGAGRDPAGITSGQTPMNPEKPFIGSGTAEDPYKISGKDDLENLRDLVNGGKDFTDVYFEVTKDIDLGGSGENPWTPIGTEENPFKGTLDGDGHTVSGLYTNDGTKDDQGLFGVNAGTIENLTVEGSVTGKDNVGGIAGTNTESGVIKDCTSNVTVTGENNVGGTAGKNDGTITDCTNNGTVTGTGNNAGGITGTNTGTVNGSDNTGAVNGNDNVGGIAGTNNGSLDNDTNTAPVTGKDDVGGITGTNGENGTVEGCTNSGNVTVSGDGDSAPGAIIGNNQNTDPDAVKDDYYQKTDTVNNGLTGIGEGTGAGTDPAGITSGQTPTKPGGNPAGTDQAAAKAFEDEKIAAIERANPVGGAAWKQAVRDAIEAFGRLTAGQKELVSTNAKKILTDAQAILAAVEKIEAIGTVTNTSACGQKIKEARDAYDKLTSEQKAMIPESTKKVLTDAESAYAALQNGSQGNNPGGSQGNNPGGSQDNNQGGSQNGGGNLTQEQKQQIQTIAKELGVSEETAAKIQAVAAELGIPVETILLNEDTIAGQKTEDDVSGSSFSNLLLKASKVKAKSVTLTWKKVKEADGYQIFGSRCGVGQKMELIKTITKSSTVKYTKKSLKKGTAYRYIVRAYKVVDGKKITIAASKTVHVYTSGGKYGNAKSVSVNKTKVNIVKGKSYKLNATLVKGVGTLKRHRKLSVCYESSNTKVATVTNKGVIKAKANGTCTIYAYAQNGVYKAVKVTVAGKAKKSTSIKLNKKTYSMKKGATYTLKPTVKPATSTDTVKWSSSNKKVATVDAYGTVTAKKKGTVTITAKTTSGKKATCKITVK